MAKQDDGLRAKPAAGDAAEAEEEDDEENVGRDAFGMQSMARLMPGMEAK
jgi:hypothetical protein